MRVRPTRRGWSAIALTPLAFCFALLHPALPPAVFAAGLAALVLSSYATAWFSLHKISIRRGSSDDAAVDKPLRLPLVITNHSRWSHLPIVIRETLPFLADPAHFVTSPPLTPQAACTLERPVLPARRGEYELSSLTLVGGDPTGLFRTSQQVELPVSLVVNPAIIPISWLPLRLRHRLSPSSTGRPLGISGVGQEFFGLREYRPSDGLRFIHWRASAKHNRLLVRQFEENSAKQVNLFIDTDATAVSHPSATGMVDNLERQITAAASLASYLAGTYCNVLFSAGNLAADEVRIDAAATQGPRIIHHLARLQPSGRTIAAQLDECFELILPHSILYCLTLTASPELLHQFDVLQARGVEIRWLHAPRAYFENDQVPTGPSVGGVVPVAVDPNGNLAAVLANA